MHSLSTSTAAPRLAERLRSSTREAHAALEDTLALTTPPLRRERFIGVLQGFRAFHEAWEPRMRALLGAPVMAGRDRRAALDRDIAALGGGGVRPRTFDLAFLVDAPAAWGSLYVLEGSTLGGQLISRALRSTPWAPAGGLAYFNPYGARTGQMWARFRAALEAASPELDPEAVAAGADATFETLRTGLPRDLEAAA